jgi:hypothetical protein
MGSALGAVKAILSSNWARFATSMDFVSDALFDMWRRFSPPFAHEPAASTAALIRKGPEYNWPPPLRR